MIKHAIFDLDGTLFDTIETIRYYVNITLEKFGSGPITREECRRFIGSGAKNLITLSMQARDMDISKFDEVFAEYNRAYNANPYYLTTVYDGVAELISALKSRGIGVSVLSNKPQAATEGAVNYFMPDTFSAVFGGREGVPLKPNPRALDIALDTLGLTADEVAYIGDSDVDVKTMKNARVGLGIAVSYGYRTKDELISAGADIIVDSTLDVLKCIIEN